MAKLVIDGYKMRETKIIVDSLASRNVTEVETMHCNEAFASLYLAFFLPAQAPLVIPKVWQALVRNQHIEILRLSPEFTKKYSPKYNGRRNAVINLQQCITMNSLRHLVINMGDTLWAEEFFDSLQRFLLHEKCQLTTLEIKGVLTTREIKLLEDTFKLCSSLEQYLGPKQDYLQAVINTHVKISASIADCSP